MALHWNLPQGKVITDAHAENLVWLTMIVQIGHLTEKSLPEFKRRLALYQRHVTNFDIPSDVLPSFVGLRTNVSDTTRTQWNRWFLELLERNLQKRCGPSAPPQVAAEAVF